MLNRQMMGRRYFIARIYANYEEAVRTIDLIGEYGDLEGAELGRRDLDRSSRLAENTSLIVTAGRTWAEAEQELKARLGD
jgi:predicted RNA-binding protein